MNLHFYILHYSSTDSHTFFCTHIGYWLQIFEFEKNLKTKLELLRKLVVDILPIIYELKLILMT